MYIAVMELIENICLFCKKTTSVLCFRDSNLYFKLLNKYHYDIQNLNNIQYKTLFIQKNLCLQCAFTVDRLSTFINNIIAIDFDKTILDNNCYLCHEETDCLYNCNTLTKYFQEKLILFLKKISKHSKLQPSWQICLQCSHCVVTFFNVKEIIWGLIAPTVNQNYKEEINTNEDNKHYYDDVKDDAKNKSHDTLNVTKCTNNVINGYYNKRKKLNNDQKLTQQIIRNINSANRTPLINLINANVQKQNETTKSLHKESVSDETIQIIKTKTNITNEKIYNKSCVKLTQLNFNDFKCFICKIHFASKETLINHKLIYHMSLTPSIESRKCSYKKLNKSKHTQPNLKMSRQPRKIDESYNIIPEICEVVYSDEENGQFEFKKENNVVIISDEETDQTKEKEIKLALNYTNVMSNIINNYEDVDHTNLKQKNVVCSPSTVTYTAEEQPAIRVRTDLF